LYAPLQKSFSRLTHVINRSSIIENIRDQDKCQLGSTKLAIFYFDFRNKAKQDARDFLSSVIDQLCQQSDELFKVLSTSHSNHPSSTGERPSVKVLLECLEGMLALPGQGTIYIVIDALDECPCSFGQDTGRDRVLNIMKRLIESNLPHLRFCATSRPEGDIKSVFEAMTRSPSTVSLEERQMEEIAQYVKSVVKTDAKMGQWPEEVQAEVIDTLAENSRGMYVVMFSSCATSLHDDFRFRWAYCQLETLRNCKVRDISSTLKGLPKDLNETYERILQGIPDKMRKDAHRIFQWLTVSFRPLRVEELADVFAIDFDEETSGIPKFEPSWHESNAEDALLSACSTLVRIVDDGYRKTVEFSHFSVQEYLTSNRTANPSAPVSYFHVLPKLSHVLLAKACLSVVFQIDYSTDEAKLKDFPLARYAAECWFKHARFEDVSLDIRDGMDRLFDKDKPHLAAWNWLYDVERSLTGLRRLPDHPARPRAVPLYYAALYGFLDLAERLLETHPQHLHARGGDRGTPLHAAADKGHVDIVFLLLDRGVDVESQDSQGRTALYIASESGRTEVVRSLIDRGANLNAEARTSFRVGWTPLHAASARGLLKIVRVLLEHGANVDARSENGLTPLHSASQNGPLELMQLLLDHGVDASVRTRDSWTALHFAAVKGNYQVTEVLLKRGADPHIQTKDGRTPFQMAKEQLHRRHGLEGRTQVMRLLSERTGERIGDSDTETTGRSPKQLLI
jgi:ankyrin repeat protein